MTPLRSLRNEWFFRQLGQNYSLFGRDGVLLWGHLGLGDQVSAARSYEIWAERCSSVHVPCKPRNAEILRRLYAYIPNLTFEALDSDDPRDEERGVHFLSRKLELPVVNAGRALYYHLKRLFPDFGINRLLALCLATNPIDLESFRLRAHLERTRIVRSLTSSFVFIDHHPDTPSRRVPDAVIDELQSKNIDIVFNSSSIPFHELFELMDQAEELHLVASAPLCLALATGTSSKMNVCYTPSRENLLKGDYGDNWLEVSLGGESSFVGKSAGNPKKVITNVMQRESLRRLVSRFPT